MSRHDRISSLPAPGVSHRIHGMRSFTEVVTFGELVETAPATPVLLPVLSWEFAWECR